jgi:hypothetical protein
MPGRLAVEQAIINNVKMARSLIRLRHSIEADEELNLILPVIRTRLEAQAQEGRITGLSYDDLRTIIYGMDAE